MADIPGYYVKPYTGRNAAGDIQQGTANAADTVRTYGPIPGYDNRDWTHVQDQGAFDYGGYEGGAQDAVDRYRGLAGAADARGAVQADLGGFNAAIDYARANEPNQNYLGSRYAGIIRGNVTTPAQQQLAQGQTTGLGMLASRVSGARGGGASLASAQAAGADAGSALTGGYNANLAQLRAREQMNAIQGLGQVVTQRREQDMQRTNMYGDNAYRQAALAGQSQGQNDQRSLGYEHRARDVYVDQTQAQQAGEKAEQGWLMAQRRQTMENDARNAANYGKVLQGGAGVAGGILGAATMSDVRAKKDIVPAGAQVDQMMGAMSPYGYRYKQPDKYGQGEQVGPMAQDLAATPAGRTAVVPTKEGLAIDGKQATKLSLAGIARLDQRLRQVEQDRSPAELDEYAAAKERLRAGPVRDADLRYVTAYEQPGRIQDVDANPADVGITVMPKQAAPQGLVAVAPPAHAPGLVDRLAGYKDQIVGGISGAAHRGLAALRR